METLNHKIWRGGFDGIRAERLSHASISAYNKQATDKEKLLMIHIILEDPQPELEAVTLKIGTVCCATIEYIKLWIWALRGISPARMQIMFAGVQLENQKSLHDYHVKFGDKLRLVLTQEDMRSAAITRVVDRAKERCKSRNGNSRMTKCDVYRAFAELEGVEEMFRGVPSSDVILSIVAAAMSTVNRFPTFKEFDSFMQHLKDPTLWHNYRHANEAELARFKKEFRTRETRTRLKAEEQVRARLSAEQARARLEEEEKRLMTKKHAEVAEEKLRMKAACVRKERLDKAEEALARADKELYDAEARVARARNAETKIKMEQQRDCKIMARDNAKDLLQQVRRDIAHETPRFSAD